jgi:hypothetical protein
MTTMAAALETNVCAPVAAVTLIDEFIQQRGSGGPFPPPLSAVAFQLVASGPQGGQVAIDPPIILTARTNGLGVFLFAGEGTIGASPVLRIPAGPYRLLVASDYYQPATLDLDWPPDPAAPPTILLKPASAYPFPDLTLASNQLTVLGGNLYAEGGDRAPVAGAVVAISAPANAWPFATCVTDANGGFALVIPLGAGSPAFSATLHFAPPNAVAFDVANVPVQPGAFNSLPQTALRGTVRTATGAPIVGAVVTIAGVTGAAASARDGTWSFYMSLDQPDLLAPVTATAPGGRNQSQTVQIRNRVTVLVPAFQIGPS